MITETHTVVGQFQHKIAQVERRKNYRIHINELDPRLEVSVTLESGHTAKVKLINYSFGGILFYAPADFDARLHERVPQILFKFPNKPAVQFSGEFVRVDRGEDKVFCAVSFNEEALSQGHAHARDAQREQPARNAREEWIDILQSLPNYMHDSTVDLYHDTLRLAYEKYSIVVKDFTVEEKWWFFELLDELKRREPDYPEPLLDEFITMCEGSEARQAA